ncbi:MAG: glutamyl-tRNA reductase, partial [Marinoscillum sp.]
VPAEITLVNRTLEKAEKKATELNFRVAPFENLNEVVATSNVVICAVQADEPVIKATLLQNNHQPKLLIDLSVPRSIEEQVAQVSGVILYNVDQLQEKASKALEQRRAAIPQVAAIITESINEFGNWSNEMEVSPTIKKLKEALEEIRKQELARYIDKMDEKEAKILDKATRSMIQKVLKLPVLQLKAACKRGEAETLVGVLNDLFNLEQEKTTSK